MIDMVMLILKIRCLIKDRVSLIKGEGATILILLLMAMEGDILIQQTNKENLKKINLIISDFTKDMEDNNNSNKHSSITCLVMNGV